MEQGTKSANFDDYPQYLCSHTQVVGTYILVIYKFADSFLRYMPNYNTIFKKLFFSNIKSPHIPSFGFMTCKKFYLFLRGKHKFYIV